MANNIPDFDYRSSKYHLDERVGNTQAQPASGSKTTAAAAAASTVDIIAATEPVSDLTIPSLAQNIPSLPNPLSHQSLNDAVEHFIHTAETLSQSNEPYFAECIQTDLRKRLAEARKERMALNAEQAATAPKSQEVDGLAAFTLIKAMLSKNQTAEQKAEQQWASQLNQLTLAQLQQLEAEGQMIQQYERNKGDIAKYEKEMQEKGADMKKLEEELEHKYGKELVEMMMGAIGHWAEFTKIMDHNGNNFLAAFIELEQKSPEFKQWAQEHFPGFVALAKQYSSDQLRIESDKIIIKQFQNELNKINESGGIGKLEAKFIADAKALGITLNIEDIPAFLVTLKMMEEAKEAIQNALNDKFNGSNALAVFTAARLGIAKGDRNFQKVLGETVANTNQMNIQAQNLLHAINVELDKDIAEADKLQDKISDLNTAIKDLTIVIAALTVAAMALAEVPIAGEIAAAALAAATVVLGGLMIERGVLQIKLSDEEKKIAGEKREESLIMNNCKYSQEMADTMTQGLIALAKQMEQMLKDGEQATANISASIPQ